MKIQQLNQSKIFFKKWFYRIECVQPGASRIIHSGVNSIEQWCLHQPEQKNHWGNPWGRWVNKEELYEFVVAVKPFLKNKDLQIRTEDSHFNFYCNDLELVEKINKKLSKWVKRISGPTSPEELEFLQSNSNKKVLCNNLPKGRYRYKLFLNNNMAGDRRSKFYSWTKTYEEQIDFTKYTEKWLEGKMLWLRLPYMYVENEKTLSMIGLYLGRDIRQIQEFVPRNAVIEA